MISQKNVWMWLLVVVSLVAARTLAEVAEPEKRVLEHLRSIGQACMMYANDNRGFLPKTFGQLAPSYIAKPAIFLDPRLKSSPPADWDTMTPAQQQDWIEKNCEFDFTELAGRKIQKVESVSTSPLVQSRDKEGVKKAILYVDGHAEFEVKKPSIAPTSQP